MERESGFYWLRSKNNGEWTIGEWEEDYSQWVYLGNETCFTDSEVTEDHEIGRKIKEPSN